MLKKVNMLTSFQSRQGLGANYGFDTGGMENLLICNGGYYTMSLFSKTADKFVLGITAKFFFISNIYHYT